MEHHDSSQMRVGLFVFAGVFLAMVAIFFLGSNKQLFKRQYNLTTTFEDISGLRVGGQVQLAGLVVGMVDRISFAQVLGDKKVQVRLNINKEFQERICSDSLATINTQGLLGDKIIFISPGNPDKSVLQDGDFLPSEERPSLFTIAEKGGDIMDNINKASKELIQVLQEIEKGDGLLHTLVYESKSRPVGQDFSETAKELKVASKELKEILQKVNRGEGTIGALLADPSVYNDIRRLFGKLERNNLLRHVIRSRIRDLELEKSIQKGSEQNLKSP